MNNALRHVDENHPEFMPLAFDTATEHTLYDTLQAIANTPAPSQTASRTRGRVIEKLLGEAKLQGGGVTYTRNAFGSGCDLLEQGTGGVRFVAHLDEISYLVTGERRGDAWPLVPFCYHLAEGPRQARAIRYDSSSEYYQVVGKGEIRNEHGLCFFGEEEVALAPGDRVVFNYPIEIDEQSKRVTGHLDNAAGATCALMAAQILCKANIPFSIAFTDEEEGPAGQSSQTIARGASRIYPHLPPAPLDVVIDVHGLNNDELERSDFHRRGWGASLAEFSSHARGTVTPPDLYSSLRDVAEALVSRDVKVRENVGGYVSRSDDVGAMMCSTQVALLGYPGINRHFDQGVAATNLEDLRDLTIALAVLGAVFYTKKPRD